MLVPLLDRLAGNLNELSKSGFFPAKALTTGDWLPNRWLHATVWGALIRAVPSDKIPLIEPSISQHFRPDLVVVSNKEIKLAVVEYESANSSDERLVIKDLVNFTNAIKEYASESRIAPGQPGFEGWVVPKLWLIISTLPTCRVSGWKWWPYNEMRHVEGDESRKAGPPLKDREERKSNPLKYYERSLHEALRDTRQRIEKLLPSADLAELELVWANLSEKELRIMNINGEPQPRQPGRTQWPVFGGS